MKTGKAKDSKGEMKWRGELPRVQEHWKERTELLWEGLGRAEYLLPILN